MSLLSNRKVLVTGGAGFIGSHLVDALMMRGAEVVVFDNLSGGNKGNFERWLEHPSFRFIHGDLRDKPDLAQAVEGCQDVWHLAADPEVRLSSEAPDVHFEHNTVATFNLLEAIRETETAQSLVFTSSSTVYGDAAEIPTPENYVPLEPISVYGATKLASEALISAYAHTYGFKAVVFRFANIIGPRSRHGVIYDFIRKLGKNPHELEILGDGTQAKSYLYVNDCVEAMLHAFEKGGSGFETFNLGSDDWIDVKSIAKTVVEEMGFTAVSFHFTGGVDGGRGWKGDVKYMRLAIDRMTSLGWRPKLNSAQAVRRTAADILGELS